MSTPPIKPIQYDPAAAVIAEHGLAPGDLAKLAPRLDAARAEVLADAELWSSGGEVPTEKQPLDAGFMELPERLLAEYRERRDESEHFCSGEIFSWFCFNQVSDYLRH